MGERAGLKVRRVGSEVSLGNAYSVSKRCALSDGFSLHANVLIKASDRKKLEKLCRYTARPPIALERAHILANELEGKSVVNVVTDSQDTLDLVQAAKKISGHENLSVYYVPQDLDELKWNGYSIAEGVSLVVYSQKTFRSPDPYAAYRSYGSTRTDFHGRDLLANTLFDASNSNKAKVEFLSFGSHSCIDILAQVLARAKSEGFRPGSAGVRVGLFDLALDHFLSVWGFKAYDLMANWDVLLKWQTSGPQGTSSLEYIDLVFRAYSGALPTEFGDPARAWRNGKIPIDELEIDSMGRSSRGFLEIRDGSVLKRWKGQLTNDGLDPARLTSSEAKDLSWNSLEHDFLLADALTLTYLEDTLFDPGSEPLRAAREEGAEVSWESIRNTRAIGKHTARVSQRRAIADLKYFNSLNRNFHALIRANSPNYHNNLYRLRRSLYGRGLDFGGRWKETLKTCSDWLRLQGRSEPGP